MKTLPADSIDAVVTDPPYGLGFMGKEWDTIGDTGRGARVRQERSVEMTPIGQGHSTSTGPYLAAGVDSLRSAGEPFEQWCGMWAKECLRVLKPGGYLLAFGGTRTYHRLVCGIEDAGFEIRDSIHWIYGSGFPKSRNLEGDFQGWGTALKPGHEPIVVARKPLVDTVAANVLLYGTGALNIDGCRIETADNLNGGAYSQKSNVPRNSGSWRGERASDSNAMRNAGLPGQYEQPDGRWPANVVFDEDAAAELDAMSGFSVSQGGNASGRSGTRDIVGGFGFDRQEINRPTDSGGASRFFYTAKASRSERGAGNDHPTVKPVSLMRWLVRLVTPRDGTILDPFAGSGTTVNAAIAERFNVVGIELDAHYCDLVRKRTSNVQQTLPMEEAV